MAQGVWNAYIHLWLYLLLCADYILGMGDSGLGSVFFMHSPPAKQKH